ncbi:hypothetical protein [Oceanobacillus timonensis]|uniref:hypothetical protein n=1 Tax=Oceanobacillus timonensis TaxID=1926285 RepID=UPI0009BA5B89|nr:hypothetical protein [Oceanobacillus timonensis]
MSQIKPIRTGQNLVLAVIERNLAKGYFSEKEINWLIKELKKTQEQLDRQIQHEEYLLEELKKRGWPEDIF